jgi:stearoyl-CoA desaturase (delta-9 desaturase)
LGDYKLNVTTFWIDMFAKIGWAWDLKQPSQELVRKTIEKHGDGSHPVWGHGNNSEGQAHAPVEAIAAPGDETSLGY